MNQLRALALAILDKVDQLLTTEPARLIGYGAAVVLTVTVEVLNARGITRFGTDLTFDQAIGLAFGAIGFTVTVVESIRRFVYAPMTYIEDLSDTAMAAHEDAHFEEELSRAITAARVSRTPETTVVSVGSATSNDATGKVN